MIKKGSKLWGKRPEIKKWLGKFQFKKGHKPKKPFKKGQHISPETEFKKGNVSWSKKNKGKYHLWENRQHPTKGKPSPLKGIPLSKETKKKIGKANKGKLSGEKHPNFNNWASRIPYGRKYPEKARTYHNNYNKKKRKTDKNFNIKSRLRCLFGNALRVYTKTGKIKKSKEYGIDWNKVIEHLKPFPKDLSLYHVDHIRPLCSFNFINKDCSQNLEEIKIAFAPENHQWLLAEENMIKGGRYKIIKIQNN